LIHIEPGLIIGEILKKAEKDEDADEDPYEDEEEGVEKPPIFNEFESEIVDTLKAGLALSNEQIVSLLNYRLSQTLVQNKGFILDLPDNIEILRALIKTKSIDTQKAGD
jgi:hypothetical protein